MASGRQRVGFATTSETPICALRVRPGRVIFQEKGNADAWIATNLSVSVPRNV